MPVYYCKTFIIRINYYSFNVVKQKALTRMNNINLQVIETVDYLIDVGVDEVHVRSDTTEDDVGDFEIRDEVWKFDINIKEIFLTCFFEKDNDRMGSDKNFRISHLVLLVYLNTNQANLFRGLLTRFISKVMSSL